MKSILTDDMEHCFLCGSDRQQIHHIFGAANRKKSEADGLVIPVCLNCHMLIHQNQQAIKKVGQIAYERSHTREEFMKRYGKNYL